MKIICKIHKVKVLGTERENEDEIEIFILETWLPKKETLDALTQVSS